MTLLLGPHDVAAALPMDVCISAVRDALAALARGEAVQPLRGVMWLPDRRGALGTMPSTVAPLATLGVKVITVFPGNADSPFETHQGVVLVFDDEHGRLRGIVDASAITAIRTAAASALATDVLARPDADVLAVLGSGSQAAAHLEALPLVREFREIRLWGRRRERAERLASRHDGRVTVCDDVATAVRGAGVVCTVTAATEPILPGSLLEPGMHVNAVGASVPVARELDGEAMARCRIFVDRRESALAEAGDYLLAKAEGFVDEADLVADLGDVLVGAAAGRRDPGEITLFESLGIGVEDLAAAHLACERAAATGRGTEVDLGGRRE